MKIDATPDERPLEPAELAVIRRFLPDLRIRCSSLFGRLSRFILFNHNYERSPLWRRLIVNSLASLDYALLSLPFVRSMAGYAVFYGHVPNPRTMRGIKQDVN